MNCQRCLVVNLSHYETMKMTGAGYYTVDVKGARIDSWLHEVSR